MDLLRPIPLRTDFSLTPESAFSYRCRACGNCCRGKVIPVNPYDVARLAQTLASTTTHVLERFTTNGGATLAVLDDGACVFLGEQGCGVHEGRPLACRLYPLGRRLTSEGEERFAEVVPHPASMGVHGGPGTVDDYLSVQGAGPYLEAADRYVGVLRRMAAAFSQNVDAGSIREDTNAVLGRAPTPEDESWLDMDAVLARRCAISGEAVPCDIAGRTRMHLAALEEVAARFESR